MSGPLDDVRLPFSTIDPVMGDVFSVLWEPDMMGDTGNALKILTSEVLTQFGQQVLAMTVMTALLSALQWPMSEFLSPYLATTANDDTGSAHETGIPHRQSLVERP
jgi:hypothetical protein